MTHRKIHIWNTTVHLMGLMRLAVHQPLGPNAMTTFQHIFSAREGVKTCLITITYNNFLVLGSGEGWPRNGPSGPSFPKDFQTKYDIPQRRYSLIVLEQSLWTVQMYSNMYGRVRGWGWRGGMHSSPLPQLLPCLTQGCTVPVETFR